MDDLCRRVQFGTVDNRALGAASCQSKVRQQALKVPHAKVAALKLTVEDRGNPELGTWNVLGRGRPLQVPVGHGLEEAAQAQEHLILSAGRNQLQGDRRVHS